MAQDPEPAKPPPRDADDISTEGTATENTPLIQSETGSSRTLTPRDGSPASAARAGGAARRAPDDSEPPLGWKRAVCIMLSMWVLIFLQACNMSGMTMTQSIIAADLDAYEHAMWFTSSYLIVMASLGPLVGRLAMIFSPGNLVLVSAVFFAAGATVSALARTFAVFIFGRVLTGAGGAGVLTLSMILVLQLTSKKRRGLFIGVTNAGFTIGLSTGAVVYGALLSAMGWRALFWVQAPTGLLAGLGVYLSMPDVAAKGATNDKTVWQRLATIDYAGAITLTISIVLFLYGLSGTIQIIPIILSAVALAGFIAIEYLVAPDPIIPLAVLQSRGILLTCTAQLGFMAARWTVLYFSPIFVLAVRGLSPTVAGSVLIPTNAGFGSGGLVVGWLHIRRGGSFWLPSLVSLAGFGLALSALSFLSTAAAPAWLYVLVVFLNGFATGSALSYTLAHLLHLAAPESHFISMSLLATFRSFAGSFGTAIGGGVFARTLRDALTKGYDELDGGDPGLGSGRRELITRLIGSPALVFGGDLSDAERAVAVTGYEDSLRVLFRSAAAMCILVLLVQAASGWTAPVTEEEEEEIEEAIAEHDGRMEA